MLRASVAQNDTPEVSAIAKVSDSGLVAGCDISVPRLPPSVSAHTSRPAPHSSRNGADSVSSHLIDSIPFQMK